MPMPPLALIRQMVESGSKELPAFFKHVGDYALHAAQTVPDYFKTGAAAAMSPAEAAAKYGLDISQKAPLNLSGSTSAYNLMPKNITASNVPAMVTQKRLMDSNAGIQQKVANLVEQGKLAPDSLHNDVDTSFIPEGMNAGKSVYSAIHDDVLSNPMGFTLPSGLTPNNQFRNGQTTANSLQRHGTEQAGRQLLIDPAHQLNGLKTFQPNGKFSNGLSVEDYHDMPLNQKIGTLLTDHVMQADSLLNMGDYEPGALEAVHQAIQTPQGGLSQFKTAAGIVHNSDVPATMGDTSLRWQSILDALSNGNEGAINPDLLKGLGYCGGGSVHTPGVLP